MRTDILRKNRKLIGGGVSTIIPILILVLLVCGAVIPVTWLAATRTAPVPTSLAIDGVTTTAGTSNFTVQVRTIGSALIPGYALVSVTRGANTTYSLDTPNPSAAPAHTTALVNAHFTGIGPLQNGDVITYQVYNASDTTSLNAVVLLSISREYQNPMFVEEIGYPGVPYCWTGVNFCLYPLQVELEGPALANLAQVTQYINDNFGPGHLQDAGTGYYYQLSDPLRRKKRGAPPPPYIRVAVLPKNFVFQVTIASAPVNLGIPVSTSANTNIIYVDWGDGSPVQKYDVFTTSGSKSYTYTSAGVFNVSVAGTMPNWDCRGGNAEICYSMTDILQHGKVTKNKLSYGDCSALGVVTANDAPSSTITDMYELLREAYDARLNVTSWNVSQVTDLSFAFAYNNHAPIGLQHWDTSSVEWMDYIFYFNADAGNITISGWNFSSINEMARIFSYSTAYSPTAIVQAANLYFYANVYSLTLMFYNADLYGVNVTSWSFQPGNTNVNRFNAMFRYCTAIVYGLETWNTTGVTSMRGMFYDWDVVLDANYTLDFHSWDVSSVVFFEDFFHNPVALLPVATGTGPAVIINVTGWNISSTTALSNFGDCSYSSSDECNKIYLGLNTWNVSNVLNFRYMFARNFNQVNVSTWNVTKGTNFQEMFRAAVRSPSDPPRLLCPDVSNWKFKATPPINLIYAFSGITCSQFNTSAWDTQGFNSLRFTFFGTYNVDTTHWNTQNLGLLETSFVNANPNITSWNIAGVSAVISEFNGDEITNDFGISVGNFDTFLSKFCDQSTLSGGSVSQNSAYYTNATALTCLLARSWSTGTLTLLTVTPTIFSVTPSGPDTHVTINTTVLTPAPVVPYFYANVTITRGATVHYADQMPSGTQVLYSSVSGGPVTFTNFTALTGDVVTFSLNAPSSRFQLWRSTTFIV